MSNSDDVLDRIDEIEEELRALSGELYALRAHVAKMSSAPVTAALPPRRPPDRHRSAPPSTQDAPSDQTVPVQAEASAPLSRPGSEAQRETAIASARLLLSAGRPEDALDELGTAIQITRAAGDREGLERLAQELQGIARYRPSVRARALELASLARAAATDLGLGSPAPHPPARSRPVPTPPAGPQAAVRPAPASPRAARVGAPSAPPKPPRRGPAELARDWELVGPRGFAIVGGAVTALGIILLFVLAANNGWITPSMRVLIGVGVSALAIGAGFWARARYEQMQVSLGAAGAGIAGTYACLAAATARYDLVPDWLALPLAAAIAAVAVVIAVTWSSQIVAAIGLLGAALAPGLQAIDTGMTWAAAAFGVIVLVATISLAIPRRWHLLLIGIAAVVTAEVAWLSHAADAAAGRGTVAVVAALVLAVLVAGVCLQLTSKTVDLNPLASSFALAALGIALLVAPQLSESGRSRGIALAAAAVVWAVGWAFLRVRQPSLGLVLGISALTLIAVASADLLSGTGLAVTWAAESVLLSILARRVRDVRLQVMALAYGVLAAVYVLGFRAPPEQLFDDPVDGAAAISVVALAFAFLAAGLLAPADPIPRTETGLLAWLSIARSELASHRPRLRDGLAFGGAALGTYAAMIALVAVSFERGHLAATVVSAAVGSAAALIAARRCSVGLVAASLVWLAVVYLEAAVFDVPEFAVTGFDRSYGGWALIAAAAGALAGCFVFQVVYPKPGRPIVPGIAGAVALVSWFGGLALVSPFTSVLSATWIGWRMIVPVAVFLALSASVFRVVRHRDLATIMWALGLAAVIVSEWLLVKEATWRAVAYSITATAVASLAKPLREPRLWVAGWCLALGTGVITLTVLSEQWIFDGPEPRLYALAALAVAAALAAVSAFAWTAPASRELVTVGWVAGLVALIFGEAFILGGGSRTAFAAALSGGVVALLTAPLREQRLWWGGAAVVSVASAAVLILVTPVAHFVTASTSPGRGLWVAIGCLGAGLALRFSGPAYRRWIDPIVGVGALYILSLGVLEVAERAFAGSVETDFGRGHVVVSVLWALIGLALLVAGLLRDERLVRFGGLALFGLSLAKIFLYDLSALSSVARALSFIAVGALVLAGGFFLQRLNADDIVAQPTSPEDVSRSN